MPTQHAIKPRPIRTQSRSFLQTRTYQTYAAAITLIVALTALSPAPPAFANLQQAPNSRVVIDLPKGYEPSPLFSGFQNDNLGVTFVILEAAATAYDDLIAGFDAATLSKRGITDAETRSLNRTDTHLYMRARQVSTAGVYAKFFVAFKTTDQAILVSVNVPEPAIKSGNVNVAAIEAALATARTVPRRAEQTLYRLTELGSFKEARTLVGTSKVLTLDGKLSSKARTGGTQASFIIAPSLDRRPVSDASAFAEKLLRGLSGYNAITVEASVEVEIAGMPGVEIEATATNATDGTPVRLHQTLLSAPGGGYFRLLGMAPETQAAALLPEFRRIARGFELARQTADRSNTTTLEPAEVRSGSDGRQP